VYRYGNDKVEHALDVVSAGYKLIVLPQSVGRLVHQQHPPSSGRPMYRTAAPLTLVAHIAKRAQCLFGRNIFCSFPGVSFTWGLLQTLPHTRRVAGCPDESYLVEPVEFRRIVGNNFWPPI